MAYTVKDILRFELKPALGCTEPAAVALGAASAALLLPEREVQSIEMWVDPRIYKNGLAVPIPASGGLSGLDIAAALGALGGNPMLKLGVLESIDDSILARALDLVRKGNVTVNLLHDHQGLHIRTLIRSGSDVAESVIQDRHDNVVSLILNGREVSDSPLLREYKERGETATSKLEDWLKTLSLEQLLGLIKDLDAEDMEFLEQGVLLNMRLAGHGLKHGPGLGVGQTFERMVRQGLIKRDMMLAAKMTTSAAADARMAGVKLPAMSSAGSGNQGLTATLPIWTVLEFVECEKKAALEAIGLSHIITAFVKAHTGRLSAVCGCSIAAGSGAAAGVTYLLGGDIREIAGAIINLVQDLAGVICDGAKAGCAFKLATAAGTAVQSALFSLQGTSVKSTDGIAGASMEQTIQNIGRLSTRGMVETDRTILKIMLDKDSPSTEE